jgi:excisionase family DNA binding protein
MSQLLTVKQASERLGVSPYTVRRWAAAGYLPVLWTPTAHRRFQPADVVELVRRMAAGPPR